jgi:hypothetical protein
MYACAIHTEKREGEQGSKIQATEILPANAVHY